LVTGKTEFACHHNLRIISSEQNKEDAQDLKQSDMFTITKQNITQPKTWLCSCHEI